MIRKYSVTLRQNSVAETETRNKVLLDI